MIMKLYTVLKMMNIEYIVMNLINYVLNDSIKIISNHKPTLIIFVKDNKQIRISNVVSLT